ncbi:SRPBCC family protein [Caulobacter sp. DWR1-3-2b1]|uniref:SRPBCC family protein n=1 Tax=Caulobacter sp. DWR1-3-2b1 TaxID=2804670 RepID=UPI003CE9567D
MSKMQITTPTDCELVVTRAFDAPRHLIFDCLGKAELVKRWLLGPPGWTMPVCEVDFRVGGKFRYVWRNADGRDMGMGGEFIAIAPERIVHEEMFDDDWTGGRTRVTTDLVEGGGKTTMVITVLYASKEARDGAKASGMADGMEFGYARLDDLLGELV